MGEKNGPMILPGDAKPADQTALNVGRYAEVYEMCLGQARRIADDQKKIPQDHTLQITESIFSRFWQDQVEMQGKAGMMEHFRPVIEALKGYLERQGYMR